MKILQVHSMDLPGRNFNGYSLQNELNKWGIDTKLMVKQKMSQDENVVEMKISPLAELNLRQLESENSMNNLLLPYGKYFVDRKEFIEADIVHYHMIHHFLVSLYDMADLSKKKSSVWTIHDPWIVTGHCIHPLDCNGWLDGCRECRYLEREFLLRNDTAHEIWKSKKRAFADLDIDIVVASEFMKQYIEKSPLTNHLKNIHIIPFGIKREEWCGMNKEGDREYYKIAKNKFVIGFRVDNNQLKGCTYIWQMLNELQDKDNIVLLCIGNGEVPEKILSKFDVIRLGWQNDKETIRKFYGCCDIFLMPSLAESFGVMALEAMISEVAVICFKETVPQEIINDSECGIAVEYKNSYEMGKAVDFLKENRDICKQKAQAGRIRAEQYYSFDTYVEKHLKLYEDIMEKRKV